MAENFRSDGKAVDVTLASEVTKGDLTVQEGFFGIAMADGASGEQVALEIAQREFEFTVGSGVTAAKGDVLYVTDAGAVTNTASGNTAAIKVTVAKDANDVCWGVLLPQA